MDKRFRGAVVDVFVALLLAALVSGPMIYTAALVHRFGRRALHWVGVL